MIGFSVRSIGRAVVASLLILAVLARAPFANGVLLHEHGVHGVHAHAVAVDDIRQVGLRAAWHRHHDDSHDEDRDDRNNDSDGGEYGDSKFLFVSVPAAALGIPCSSGSAIASIQRPPSKVFARLKLPRKQVVPSRLSLSSWPSAHPLRPAFALDALLQSSHALLL